MITQSFDRRTPACSNLLPPVPGRRLGTMVWAAIVCSIVLPDHLPAAEPKRIAVVVHQSRSDADYLSRHILSRAEAILNDNNVRVLDRDEAKRLSTGLPELENQGAVITAERLLEIEEEFRIDSILNIFFEVEFRPTLGGYYSAACHLSAREISSRARVRSGQSLPMGVVGNPVSDGLTRNAAATNAMNRALDEVMADMAYDVYLLAEPQVLNIRMTPVSAVPRGISFTALPAENDSELGQKADLYQETWQQERVTATAVTRGGGFAAVAGYIWQQNPRGRVFGSRLHILDLDKNETLNQFEVSPLAMNARHERGTKEVFQCAFLDGWRYLVAINGNELFCWDVERGRLVESHIHGERARSAVIRSAQAEDHTYLSVLINGRVEKFYRFEVRSR